MFYQQLFELSILHNYYQNQVCPDLIVEPTIECLKILRGHRLILKNKINGIVVIAPVDLEHKPWIELKDNLQFTFILKLKNPEFIDFTDIEWQPINSDIYCFNNQKIDQIAATELEANTTKLSERNLSGGQNLLGIVDIYNNLSMPKKLNQMCEYKITFKSKKQQWKYYIVTDMITNEDNFLIAAKDTNTKEKITFTRITSMETDPIISVVKQKFPQSQQHIFQSDTKIACQEGGIKDIQLLNTKDGKSSNVWIEHLPNPPNATGVQVINVLKYL
jgi:hypothetical protein